MANLSYTRIVLSGLNPTLVAASGGGDLVAPNERGFLRVKNGGGSSITVTIPTPGVTKFGLAEPDITVAVPAGEERVIGPLRFDLVDPTSKAIPVTYSGVTSVTVGAFLI